MPPDWHQERPPVSNKSQVGHYLLLPRTWRQGTGLENKALLLDMAPKMGCRYCQAIAFLSESQCPPGWPWPAWLSRVFLRIQSKGWYVLVHSWVLCSLSCCPIATDHSQSNWKPHRYTQHPTQHTVGAQLVPEELFFSTRRSLIVDWQVHGSSTWLMCVYVVRGIGNKVHCFIFLIKIFCIVHLETSKLHSCALATFSLKLRAQHHLAVSLNILV